MLGFAPGYDREVVSPGAVKRVFEAYYAKILVPLDELHVPDKKNLTQQTLALLHRLADSKLIHSESTFLRCGLFFLYERFHKPSDVEY